MTVNPVEDRGDDNYGSHDDEYGPAYMEALDHIYDEMAEDSVRYWASSETGWFYAEDEFDQGSGSISTNLRGLGI